MKYKCICYVVCTDHNHIDIIIFIHTYVWRICTCSVCVCMCMCNLVTCFLQHFVRSYKTFCSIAVVVVVVFIVGFCFISFIFPSLDILLYFDELTPAHSHSHTITNTHIHTYTYIYNFPFLTSSIS